MKLIYIGVDHSELSLDQREYFYFRDSDRLSFSNACQDIGIQQILILSTCNRSEVYAIVENDYPIVEIRDLFINYFHHNHPAIKHLSGIEAINHLLEVATGLKSMVVGEDQILHQIKQALEWTMEQGYAGKELNTIFQSVISFSKRMKTTYAISEHPLSVSYIGYLSIQNEINLDAPIMLIGSGEMSQLMLKYLDGHTIYLVNRSYDKVKEYINDQVKYIPFENRYDYIEECKLVISATASPHLVIKEGRFEIMHPMIFLDLAMPRDIDPNLKANQYVRLIDMDDLKELSNTQFQKRIEIASLIQKECLQEADNIAKTLEGMKNDSLIQRMQGNCLDLSNSTYELLVNKLDLNAHEKYVLKKVLDTQFLRIMKEPIQLIKNGTPTQQKEYATLMDEIIKLKEEGK